MVLFLSFCLLSEPVLFAAQQPGTKEADRIAQANSIYGRGMLALQQGDLKAARAAFEKVIRIVPNSPEGHNSLGWVLLAEEQIEPAIRQFHTAIQLKPDFPQAHINLANAFASKSDAPSAIREAREAVRLAPQDSEAHRTLARALDSSRDLNAATAEMRRAVELEPSRADLHDELGSLLVQQASTATPGGTSREATDEFTEALRLQPNFGLAHLHLGVLRLREKSFDEAAVHLQAATFANPESPQAHFYNGQALREKGDADAAMRGIAPRCTASS